MREEIFWRGQSYVFTGPNARENRAKKEHQLGMISKGDLDKRLAAIHKPAAFGPPVPTPITGEEKTETEKKGKKEDKK